MNNNTIAAIATGLSPSGIGIIRISGEDAVLIASSVFRVSNNKIINNFESHKVYHGYVYDNENIIDEIILIYMKAPKSYTGEDIIELQCHGGILIMQKILDVVLKNGARAAEPGEFTKRAFLNGKIDLSKAEAVMDVINSQNDYALSNSVKQLTGSLYAKIEKIRNVILNRIAYIEAALDDPEHYDLCDFSDRLDEEIHLYVKELTNLRDSFNDGKLISEGISTVILGRPNVGKSSFMNILCKRERAIVTDIAGTTRDVIEETVSVDGIILNIVDTAGIRDTDDTVEKIGVKRALDYAMDSDLIIMIVDSSSGFTSSDIEIFDFIKENGKKAVVLLNKSDLDAVIIGENIKEYIDAPVISISAKDETGVDDFKEFLKEQYYNGMIKYNDEIYISNVRHKEALNDAIVSLNNVLGSIDNGMPEDFLSIDMTDAYESLGKIIGKSLDEDVVNEIFSKFCMGK